MKYIVVLVLVALIAFVRARPDTIFDFEGEDQTHQQEGEAGHKVEGSYSWTSPEGDTYFVKYIADEDGYRVVESNVVPVSHDGVLADGNQGSFGGEEGEGEGEGEGAAE